jgi:hypothetical protein
MSNRTKEYLGCAATALYGIVLIGLTALAFRWLDYRGYEWSDWPLVAMGWGLLTALCVPTLVSLWREWLTVNGDRRP